MPNVPLLMWVNCATMPSTQRTGLVVHKARLFAMLLGMNSNDTEALQQILLNVIQTQAATLGELDEYGQRYMIDFMRTWQSRQATVRSAWIIRPDEDFPRLATCYPL